MARLRHLDGTLCKPPPLRTRVMNTIVSISNHLPERCQPIVDKVLEWIA
jgi:hypothetical protein